MSKLLPLLFLLSTFSAFASSSVNIKPGDTRLSLLSSGKIIAVDMDFGDCPAHALCQPRAAVKVRLTLAGCVDSLGPVTANFHYLSGLNEYELEMTAVNIHTARSEVVRCVRANTQVVKVYGPAGVDMNNLKLVMNSENLATSPRPVYMREMAQQHPGRPTRVCPQVYEPVCGLPKVTCERGRVCQQSIPTPPRTYPNKCTLEASAARILYDGKCLQDR